MPSPAQPEPNITTTAIFKVQNRDLASTISPNPSDLFPNVFATSRLVAFMEITCARMLTDYLKLGQLSVGVGVDMTHTAPTPEGEDIVVQAKYLGMERKLYVFEVIANDNGGEVGRARHTRAIVDRERLEKGAMTRTGRRSNV